MAFLRRAALFVSHRELWNVVTSSARLLDQPWREHLARQINI
jgi:hypothetical protein